jgi:SAM-dependent methyltransferase
MTSDCQKYFIVDGRHVGDYEGMWRDCPDPWRIEELGLRLDMRAALLLLEPPPDGGPGRAAGAPKTPLSVLDAGAGSGLFTLELAKRLAELGHEPRLVVSDIAPAALARAGPRLAAALPDLDFHLAPFDLRRLGEAGCPWPDGSFDLIVLAQVLWGLIEGIDSLFPALARKLARGGRLLMSQHFPLPGRQSYAADVADGPAKIQAMAAAAGLDLLHTLETDRGTNHHWAALWNLS